MEANNKSFGLKPRHRWLIVIGTVSLVVIGGIILAVIFAQGGVSGSIRAALKSSTGNVTFPVYYPNNIPKGFSLKHGSVGYFEHAVVSFSLVAGENKTVTVTEQAKPPLMEEVTKTKEFTTSLGKAYTANLDGHTAGFVTAEKTLIIVTPLGDVSAADLEQFMTSLTSL